MPFKSLGSLKITPAKTESLTLHLAFNQHPLSLSFVLSFFINRLKVLVFCDPRSVQVPPEKGFDPPTTVYTDIEQVTPPQNRYPQTLRNRPHRQSKEPKKVLTFWRQRRERSKASIFATADMSTCVVLRAICSLRCP